MSTVYVVSINGNVVGNGYATRDEACRNAPANASIIPVNVPDARPAAPAAAPRPAAPAIKVYRVTIFFNGARPTASEVTKRPGSKQLNHFWTQKDRRAATQTYVYVRATDAQAAIRTGKDLLRGRLG
jgi:hypothetical protein